MRHHLVSPKHQASTRAPLPKSRSATATSTPSTTPAYQPLALARYARRLSLATVGISLFLVAFMVTTRILFTAEVIATSDLRHLATVYYEDYYHAQFAAGRTGAQLIAAFEYYSTAGFRPVTLRQLLSFDNNRLASAANRFAGCDPTLTTAKITPLPPYGPQDYLLETTLVCK